MHERTPSVVTIAGSDSGGGAGIQADLKTFAAHGVHGLSIVTALTAQNTRGVSAIHVPDAAFLHAQFDACFDDFDIRVAKIGMLATREVIDVVADQLILRRVSHVVLDPVMIATSGAALLDDDALLHLRTRLLPLASVVTPNIPECDWLLRCNITDGDSADRAAQQLRSLTGSNTGAVLLKGGHLDEGDAVIDRFCDGDRIVRFVHPRLDVQAHGTGCTLASAVAANLCLGSSMQQACSRASDYVAEALRTGYRPGKGDLRVLRHVHVPLPA